MGFVRVRLAAWYVFANANGGMWVPFFPIFLAARGLDPSQISTIFGVMQLMRVFAGPMAGIAADAHGQKRTLMIWLCAGAALAYVGISLQSAFWPLLIFVVLSSMTFSPAGALMEALALRQSQLHGFDYGPIRACGSATFVAMTLLAGVLVQAYGPGVIMPVLIACVVATTAAAFFLPGEGGPVRTVRFRDRLLQTLDEAGVLMRRRTFLIFLASASLAQAAHATYYSFGAIHMAELGYSGPVIGALWAIGVTVEVVLLIYSRPLVDRFGPLQLLAAGGLVAVVRWTLLAFDPALPFQAFAQALHGLTFGLAHIGAMYFISRAVPVQLAATGQSVYSTLAYGPVMAGATFLSGPLYEHFGGLAYLGMTALAGVSAGLALLLRREWNGQPLLAAEPAPAAPEPGYAAPITAFATTESPRESLGDPTVRP